MSAKSFKAYAEAIPYGIMVWWDECKDAACYQIHLYMEDEDASTKTRKLAEITVERNMFYHTFTGLAGTRDYYIDVIAESRDGQMLNRGSVSCDIEMFDNVY